jgi:hypothetical protein
VFTNEYNFVVNHKEISSKKPTQQTSKFVTDFVYEHDEPDTLLIIYYAGHGWSKIAEPGEKENFLLLG